jgi:hypothetical protein
VAKIPTGEAQTAPICPHCDRPIGGVLYRELDQSFGKAYLWFCGQCNKTLGVSHRKGFWMG